MLDIYGYLASWAIYLIAGTLCYVLFYRGTRWIRPKVLANTLRAILIALIYTPWYVAVDQELMAPALMVILLDIVTLGEDAFIRALVPLMMSTTAAVVLVWLLSLLGLLFRGGKRETAEHSG